jgi:hypothetical protein
MRSLGNGRGRSPGSLLMEVSLTVSVAGTRFSAVMGPPLLELASRALVAMVRGPFVWDQGECVNDDTLQLKFAIMTAEPAACRYAVSLQHCTDVEPRPAFAMQNLCRMRRKS